MRTPETSRRAAAWALVSGTFNTFIEAPDSNRVAYVNTNAPGSALQPIPNHHLLCFPLFATGDMPGVHCGPPDPVCYNGYSDLINNLIKKQSELTPSLIDSALNKLTLPTGSKRVIPQALPDFNSTTTLTTLASSTLNIEAAHCPYDDCYGVGFFCSSASALSADTIKRAEDALGSTTKDFADILKKDAPQPPGSGVVAFYIIACLFGSKIQMYWSLR